MEWLATASHLFSVLSQVWLLVWVRLHLPRARWDQRRLQVIGLSAGVVCYFATITLKNTLKIDDSLDVFSVHGVGGMLGTILIAVFASPSIGIFSGNGFSDGVLSRVASSTFNSLAL